MKNGILRVVALCFVAIFVLVILPVQKADAAPTQAEVDEKIRWIIASIPDSCETDYEKALWLHDYLCKTVVYDESYSADEAYTALIYGRADCGGYADAYARLLRAVGIACSTVHGGANYSAHAWNIAILDGKCYFTDVTWDDINHFDYIHHAYFMISFEKMEEDHGASSVYNSTLYNLYLPETCNHNEYDYFKNFKDTGELGSGHFNNATTPEEAVKHFKVVAIEGTTLYWQCEFAFDGDAGDWLIQNEYQIDKLLGGYADVRGGMDGYGILKYACPNSTFTQIDSISFSEPTVNLNNSHMRQQLSVTFAPANASFQEVTYSSSDSRIAKVDENGVVRAVSNGTATITATALDGKTATCQVVVNHKHNAIRAVSAVTANCQSKGYKAHYICDSCGTLFSDSKGKNAISIMDVISPALTYCRMRDCSVQHNADGHWMVCNICDQWYYPHMSSHEDWTGDGICDGYDVNNPCGYVMNPSATKPATKPTQTTTKPTQSGTAPTKPTTASTKPSTATTAPATEETPLPESTGMPARPGQTLSTSAAIESTVPGQSTPNTSNSAQPDRIGAVQWAALILLGIAATVVVTMRILRQRKG